MVGWGTANFYETAAAPATTNATASLRLADGCTESDNNAFDFATGTPNPRNTASPLNSCSGGGGPNPNIIINEVDSDTPGTDTAEFVELYDGGVGNAALDGLVVVFYNGSNDLSYASYDLDGYSTDANGCLLGNPGVTNVDFTFAPGGSGLSKWSRCCRSFPRYAVDFPEDTPVTTANLLDALVYDTSDGDDAGLLALLNPGQPQVDENSGGNGAGQSISVARMEAAVPAIPIAMHSLPPHRVSPIVASFP